MGSRPRRALLAALLAAPLAVLGVCGSIAAMAPPAAVCEAPADGCCPRSGAPVCPRTPAPGRCAACGAAACPRLARELGEAAPTRCDRPGAIAARPTAVRSRTRLSRAANLVELSESPPKTVLLATFRN